jgi:hypothetical protein
MAPRHVIVAGAIGCSAAAVYYTYGKGRVLGKEWGDETPAMQPSSHRPAVSERPPLPDDASPLPPIVPVQKKSMGRRMKDTINRRRAQHKFPFNPWWRRRGRGPPGPHDGRTGFDSLPGTALIASEYKTLVQDVQKLARELLRRQDQQLAPRFDNLEIARYAVHYGLLRIEDGRDRNSEGYRMVVQDAAEGIVDSQQWFERHVFASIQTVHREEYAHLIRWEYDPRTDARPMLHVDLGKAVEICDNKSKQEEFANIVLTMMELASLNSPLTGIEIPPGGIDRIDVAIYARGTSAMNATSTFWILRSVVRTVSHHYPGRLNTLVLHDLPTILNWVVLGVKKLVHPDTAKKFTVVK